MRKIANFNFTDICSGAGRAIKTASSGREASEEARRIIEAEVEKHPTALFFRAKAIEADIPNNNGDSFSAKELKKSCQTFIGVPFFTNHQNSNVESAKGKVVWAEWNDQDKAIYVVAFVDREAYPNLCRGIEQEYMAGVSMGCSVEYSVCSICGNKAATLDEYCSHIRNFKGRKFTGTAKDVRTGETKQFKNAPVYEDNYGIRFIELSGVADPACTSCRIDSIYKNDEFDKAAAFASSACKTDGTPRSDSLVKAASTCFNDLSVMKVGVLMKGASQQDIEQLNQCLTSLEAVSVKLIQNRANVEMEFASDLVKILADLQQFTDELVQAGYGQLPEMSGEGIPGVLPEEQGAVPAGGAVPSGAQPVAAEEEIGAPGATNVEEPLAEAPQAPAAPQPAAALEELKQTTRPAPSRSTEVPKITRPARPERTKTAEEGQDMARRLPGTSAKAREATKQVLSGDWQEKLENFSNRLSKTLMQDPATSVNYDGGHAMAAENKKVEAKSQQADLHEITEKQLDKKDTGAMPREEDDRVVITEKQLDSLHKGEREVITEAQLDSGEGVTRDDDEREVVTEKQLESERKDGEWDVITEKQFDEHGNRVNEDREVVTEKQLSQPPTDTPWARSAAGVQKHIESAVDVLAKVVMATGATPAQVVKAAASIAGDTASERLAFAHEIWNAEPDVESVAQLAERAEYWGARGVKVAATGRKTIREAILAYASAETKASELNPEYLLEAFESAKENSASDMVETRIEELSVSANSEEPEDIKGQMDSLFKSRHEAKQEDNGGEAEADDAEAKRVEAESEALAETLSDVAGDTKVADHVFETDLAEMSFEGNVESDEFRKSVASFAKGVCVASGLKLASIVNVTVQDDTVTIAVETDGESVEIPIGEKAEVETEELEVPEAVPAEEPVPELPEEPAEGEDLLGLAKSEEKMEKKAQFGGGAPEVPNAGAGVASPEELATAPDAGLPEEGGVQTFTTEETAEEEELPGEGDQEQFGAICPFCGSNNTETGRKDQMPGQYECQDCGAKYTAHVMVELQNPEEMAIEFGEEGPEAPEAPELPVAANVDIDKQMLSKYAKMFENGELACPACGSKEIEIEGDAASHKVACKHCGTTSGRELIMNVGRPVEASMLVSWNLDPKKRKCEGCTEARKMFATDLAFRRMVEAAEKAEFPADRAVAWIDKNYGADAVATYGPHAGRKLAETVVEQLQTFGLDKVRHMKRLCEVQTQEDPMKACLKLHKRKGYDIREATRLCQCIKDKFASEEDENIFIEAFQDTMDLGILRKMAEHMVQADEVELDESEMSIADIEVEKAEIEAPVEVEKEVETEGIEFDGQEELLGEPVEAASDDVDKTAAKEEPKMRKRQPDKEKGLTRTVLEDVDDSKRGDAHMGHEKESIPEAKDPEVPRSDAKIKGEKDTVPEAQEVKVPVSLELMGEEEQIDGPTSTETLGLVVAHEDVRGKKHMSDDLGGEEGKPVGDVDTVEDADNVPRSDAKMGHESETIPPNKGPEVPRSDAKIKGEKDTVPEAADPTAPYTDEAEKVETLGLVAAESKLQEQKARIAAARREKAVRLAAKMVAQNRIAESEFEDMVGDLCELSVERMEVMAQKISAAAGPSRQASLTTPVVIEDSGKIDGQEEPKSLTEKLANVFTIGSKQADRYYKTGEVDED